ncbi:hypothetical protein PABG_11725 [Paracoccidioides brasiliensis Pb03]|nr:hypothetical protein PABG_11725 [Paracoccidioides brasiliensis Pb03]
MDGILSDKVKERLQSARVLRLYNIICFRIIAPATELKQERAVMDWTMLLRHEPAHKYFDKNEPGPTSQTLKLFAESLIAYHATLPSLESVCDFFTTFHSSKWERKTG